MSRYPYHYVYDPNNPNAGNNGAIYAHRYIAQQILGRPLQDEAVCFKDGNFENLSPDNIMIFKTLSDLNRYQKTGIYETEGDVLTAPLYSRVCEYCGKTYTSPTLKDADRFCSHECYHMASRKVERPSALQLIQDICGSSFVAVGIKYGVSDNAVRKWLKAYGLPTTKKAVAAYAQKKAQAEHG